RRRHGTNRNSLVPVEAVQAARSQYIQSFSRGPFIGKVDVACVLEIRSRRSEQSWRRRTRKVQEIDSIRLVRVRIGLDFIGYQDLIEYCAHGRYVGRDLSYRIEIKG